MELDIFSKVIDLGVTGAFLVYLYIKNGRAEKVNIAVAESLSKVHESQDRNTRVLIKVAQKHNLIDDADFLMKK